jgi:hypothetical protein
MKPTLLQQIVYAALLWCFVPFVFAWVLYDQFIGSKLRRLS